MRYITTKNRTKRGNEYNTRPTKSATGYSKSLADRGSRNGDGKIGSLFGSNCSDQYRMVLSLSVKGTLDILGNTFRFSNYVKWINKPHPLDSSYTKRVLILNDNGKKKFKRLKKEKKELTSN